MEIRVSPSVYLDLPERRERRRIVAFDQPVQRQRADAVRAQLDALRAVDPRQRERLFIEWLGIFALGISQFITNKLAVLIFFIACCCLLFGKVTFREAAAMFTGSFCVFALPYAAKRILERISDLNRCLKDWVRG